MKVESVVCYANSDIGVVLLPEHRHQVAYMPAKSVSPAFHSALLLFVHAVNFNCFFKIEMSFNI